MKLGSAPEVRFWSPYRGILPPESLVPRTDRRKNDGEDLASTLTHHLVRGEIHKARLILKGSPQIAAQSAWLAALAGDPEALSALIAANPSCADRQDEVQGTRPLVACALSRVHRINPARSDGLLQCAVLLLAAGADPNTWSSMPCDTVGQRRSALRSAIEGAGFPSLVELLLDHGASLEDSGALAAAAAQAEPRYLEILLERGADPSQAPVLQAAIRGQHPENITLLLARGADPRLVDEQLRSPVHWACELERSPEIVAKLLDAGADLDAQESRGLSPLRLATRLGCVGLSDLLLARGAVAELDQVDTFYGLCSRGLSDMALTVLSTHPELFDRVSDREESMLIDAIAKDKRSAVRAMIEVGFSVESAPAGDQPLHVAARYGRSELLYQLLDAGAPLRARNLDDRTPLDLAVRGAESPRYDSGNYIETVRILVEAGARPEAWMLKAAPEAVTDLLGEAL